MPILTIEVVGELERATGAAGRAADAAAAVLEVEAGRCWVKLKLLPREQYAENGGAEEGISPVFVSLILAQAPQADSCRLQCQQLATALATALDRPAENIHILYQPDAKGRIAFGGRLVE